MQENGFVASLPFGDMAISGDQEFGHRPYQLLVASLAVCSGGVMRKILEKMRMSAEEIEISVKELTRIEEEANRVAKVHLHFVISGQIDITKLPKVMELTRKNCSMVQSVANSIEIVETYEVR